MKASTETLLVVTAYPHVRWIPACAGMIRPEADRESEGVPQLPFPSPKIEDPPQEEWGTKGVDDPMPILASQPIEVVLHGTG